MVVCAVFFFFSSRRRHTRFKCDWSSDVCSSDLFDDGRIKFFSVNSINGLSFYNKGAHPFHRSYVQSVFDSYLREEVVPFIWNSCQTPGIAISTMGASFGAYHAANSLFKHPDVIKRCFSMSGVYDLKNFMDG